MRFPILFLCWVATLGADRLDLLGDTGPIRFVPFLALTPLVALAVWVPRLRGGRWPAFPVAARQHGALSLAFIALVALSLLQSDDLTLSAGRLALLLATVLGVSVVYWGARDNAEFPALVVQGAKWGLVFNIVCGGLTAVALLGFLPQSLSLGPAALSLEPTLYGALPRLSGATLDPNRGGILALIFGTLIAIGPASRGRTAWVSLALILVLASLSRSAILAALPVLVLSPLFLPGRRALTTGFGAVALAAALLLNEGAREAASGALAPLAERFTPREGSAQIHALLYERGTELGTRSIATAFLGMGFGTSSRALSDLFGGHEYGNFHSAWLAIWVEAGIIAVLVLAALSLFPLRRRTKLSGLLIGLFVFNVFYVGLADPAYWLALNLAWGEGTS